MNFKYPLINDESEEAIRNSIATARKVNQLELEELREKLKDFYDNNQTEAKYLGDYGFFDKDSLKYYTDLPWISSNVTKEVIDRISMVYKENPIKGLFR